MASRTWFGTLTLRPEEQYRMQMIATARTTSRRCEAFERLPPAKQFAAVHREIGAEITRYFKRVRQTSGAPLRYLLVAEAHKTGLPHYHMLVHERCMDSPVRKRTLQECWDLGFTNFKLAEKEHAFYVCKYLAKQSLARVRASLRYGQSLPVTTPLGIAQGGA